MKNTLYAIIAAGLAMFATSGIVALATAAPVPRAGQSELAHAEAELVAHLDTLIEARFAEMKERLVTALP